MVNKLPPVKYVRSFGNDGNNNAGTSLYQIISTGQFVVKKKVPADRLQKGAFDREWQICEDVKGHPNVNAFVTAETDRPDPYGPPIGVLWVEFCDMGMLDEWHARALRHGDRHLPTDFMFSIMKDVASALAWLHLGMHYRPGCSFRKPDGWDPVSHNDLHQGNVFFTSVYTDKHPRAVLGDFGHASTYKRYMETKANPALAQRDRSAANFAPGHNDTFFFGKTMAWLAGDKSSMKAPLDDGVRNYLLDRQVSSDFCHAIFQSKRVPNSWELCNLVDSCLRKYKAKYGGNRTLPTYLLPQLRERQVHGAALPAPRLDRKESTMKRAPSQSRRTESARRPSTRGGFPSNFDDDFNDGIAKLRQAAQALDLKEDRRRGDSRHDTFRSRRGSNTGFGIPANVRLQTVRPRGASDAGNHGPRGRGPPAAGRRDWLRDNWNR